MKKFLKLTLLLACISFIVSCSHRYYTADYGPRNNYQKPERQQRQHRLNISIYGSSMPPMYRRY